MATKACSVSLSYIFIHLVFRLKKTDIRFATTEIAFLDVQITDICTISLYSVLLPTSLHTFFLNFGRVFILTSFSLGDCSVLNVNINRTCPGEHFYLPLLTINTGFLLLSFFSFLIVQRFWLKTVETKASTTQKLRKKCCLHLSCGKGPQWGEKIWVKVVKQRTVLKPRFPNSQWQHVYCMEFTSLFVMEIMVFRNKFSRCRYTHQLFKVFIHSTYILRNLYSFVA